MAALLIAAFFH